MRSAVAGLIAAGILTGPARADPLLDRYRPTLAYDGHERDRATAVDAIAPRLDDREAIDLENERPGPEVVYGRRVRDPDDGRTWLQYWLFFLTNTQDRGIVQTGRHEGDWEFLQLRLGANGRADLVTLAQHSWAEGCGYGEIRTAEGAPLVFVANGSHALYSTQGFHDRQWPDPDDEAEGTGRRARPPVRPFGTWARWPGRWGDSEAGIVPGEQSSPRGPAFQERRPWQRPSAYHADHARA